MTIKKPKARALPWFTTLPAAAQKVLQRRSSLRAAPRQHRWTAEEGRAARAKSRQWRDFGRRRDEPAPLVGPCVPGVPMRPILRTVTVQMPTGVADDDYLVIANAEETKQ